MVNILVSEYGLSERRSCAAIDLSRSVYRYQSDAARDDAIIDALLAAVVRYPDYGFRRLFELLRQDGHPWNHKRVYRVYCQLELNLRQRKKHLNPLFKKTQTPPLVEYGEINQSWSADFMSSVLTGGLRFRTFHVIDDCSHEVLMIEVQLSFNLSPQQFINALERLASKRGHPKCLNMNNSPEFIAEALKEWAKTHDVALELHHLSDSMQDYFIEECNQAYCNEVLNAYEFHKISEVEEVTSRWLQKYNQQHLHK
ncbi:IS3 family transposase [Halomonas binhaiensis]|uniref:Transposase n=1 Tax=Halomonas binhaiensis TaxID=2562282 RepID=A0A5C1NFI2_9GAMM|nr:IS3 family transposase [Halomonas binhaiensis]QEM82492.1 transposase [Halomonas binhaiensis]